MRRILVTIAISLGIASLSYGQINKGDIFAGGNLNFNFANGEYKPTSPSSFNVQNRTNNRFSFGINVKTGKFISDHLAIGIVAGVNHSNSIMKEDFQNSSSEAKTNVTGFTINGFTRSIKQLTIFDQQLYLFGDLGVGYSKENSKTERTTNNNTTATSGIVDRIGASITPGVGYFVSNRFALETTFGALSYVYDQRKQYNSTTKNHNMNLNLRLSSLTFGAIYFFGK